MDLNTLKVNREGLFQTFTNDLTITKNVKVIVARLDKIHPLYGGNKLFKLLPYLKSYSVERFTSIISFGGPFSNYLYSLAAIASELGIPSLGIIRSATIQQNKTIKALEGFGMKLKFLPKSKFDNFFDDDKNAILNEVDLTNYLGPKPLWIDLGGEGPLGIEGASLIWPFLKEIEPTLINRIDHIFTPIGTGTTFLGLQNSINKDVKIWGVTCFKGGVKYVLESQLLKPYSSQILTEYAGDGFSKNTEADLAFYSLLFNLHQLDLDVVYTGKAFKALLDRISNDSNLEGKSILFVHTGGQQGNP